MQAQLYIEEIMAKIQAITVLFVAKKRRVKRFSFSRTVVTAVD